MGKALEEDDVIDDAEFSLQSSFNTENTYHQGRHTGLATSEIQ